MSINIELWNRLGELSHRSGATRTELIRRAITAIVDEGDTIGSSMYEQICHNLERQNRILRRKLESIHAAVLRIETAPEIDVDLEVSSAA